MMQAALRGSFRSATRPRVAFEESPRHAKAMRGRIALQSTSCKTITWITDPLR